jgi:hypothetical protein
VHSVPPRPIEDLIARLQPVVTTLDTNTLRRVVENTLRRIAATLDMDGCCNYESPRFDHLKASTVTSIMKTKRRILYNIFDLISNKS